MPAKLLGGLVNDAVARNAGGLDAAKRFASATGGVHLPAAPPVRR